MKLQAWGFVWKSLLGVLIVVSLPLQALAGTGASSVLVTPGNGAAVGPQSISFSWTAVPNVINYTLWIGTTPGAKDALYYSTASTSSPADTTSMTASLQPGATYYVTVWTLTAAGYTTTASSFQTQSTSYLTAPKNGATVSPLTQFAWTSVPGVINYTLSVGTTPGAKDAFYYTTANSEDSGEITSTSANLQPGVTYYATLSTLTSSGYAESTSTFQTSAMAYLTFPANGATNVNPFKPFTWTAVPGVQVYLLLVSPTGYSKWDNFASDFASTVTSGYVWALQPNTSYYATLCTQSNSGLVCSKSNFTTAAEQEPPSANAFYSKVESLTGQVRLMAPSPGNVPQAGSYLYQSMLDHNHPHTNYGASCGDFAIALAALLTENGVLTRVRQTTLDGADVHVITEYWDVFNQRWQIADATFGVVYFDPNAGIGQGVEDVSSLLTSGNTSGITPIWATSHGSSYMTGYYMDPISYYNNPYPYGNPEKEQQVYDNVPNSPLPLLNPFILGQSNPVSSAYMFYFANPGDQVTINNAGTNLTIKPTSAAGWAQTYFLYSGWSIVSPIPSGMQIFTPKGFQSLVVNASVLTAPSSGATVSSQNIQFSWTSVPGVINYTLWIGTTPGAKDALYYTTAHAPDPTAITSTSASLQPGVTYYTTLWTLTSTGYTITTSTFQTAYSSVLTAPANGATVSPRNIQFSWTAVPGVINYTLWIGTTPGAQDALYYSTSSTSNPSGVTSMTASLQPSTTYYVTLWTLTSAGYITTTSTFSTGNTSYLTTPTNGATVAAQNIQFNWTLVPGGINYTLWIGTTPGAQDALYYTTAHSSNPGGIASTSASLQPGVTYYVTLWTLTAAGYTTANSTFQTASTTYLSAPANGATVSTMTQFTWLSAPGVINYTLWVGTTPGTQDALYYTTPTGTSTTASLLPGTTYYATLWTLTSAGYTSTTSIFHTNATAVLTAPANGATNLDSGVPINLSWTPVPNITWYQIYLGSSVGAKNYYDSGGLTSASTSVSLQPNTKYYARLWTDVGGNWSYTDTVFSTGYPLAHLTYPLNGATGVSQFQPFTWTAAQGATAYGMTVSPTGYGVEDFFTGITTIKPPNTSEYVWALQPNTTYYVQLCTQNPGPNGGGCTNNSFTTGPALSPPSDRNAFYQTVQSLTAQVRLMTIGSTNMPATGTYLYQLLANHGSDPTQPTTCGWFAAALLDEFTMNDILARQRNISLNGIVGHVLTEYWDPYNQKWQIADPTFGMIFFDPGAQVGQGAEDINSLLLSGNYSDMDPLFVTSYGTLYMTSYYMDPLTNYNEVDPFGMVDAQQQLNYLPNSPLPYLTSIDLSTVTGTAGQYEFRFASSTDTLVVQSNSATITISAQNTQGWSQSAYLNTGWSIVSAVPSGMTTYQFRRLVY